MTLVYKEVTMPILISPSQLMLRKHHGDSTMDTKAAFWDAFDLTPVISSSVKVSVDTVYSTDSNGFIEIEIYSGKQAF